MRNFLILIAILITQLGLSQQENINAFEYVIVPMQFNFQNEPNEYQLNILSRVRLKDKGFKVFMDTEERPLKYRGDSCDALYLDVEDTSGFLSLSVILKLKDCRGNIIYESKETSSPIKEYKEGYQDALQKSFESMNFIYNYDRSLSKNFNESKSKQESSATTHNYENKQIYKLGGQTYWFIENENGGYSILTNEGKENFAELEPADRGAFIFTSKAFTGAAFFDSKGNLNVEYKDDDLKEIQSITFKRID